MTASPDCHRLCLHTCASLWHSCCSSWFHLWCCFDLLYTQHETITYNGTGQTKPNQTTQYIKVKILITSEQTPKSTIIYCVNLPKGTQQNTIQLWLNIEYSRNDNSTFIWASILIWVSGDLVLMEKSWSNIEILDSVWNFQNVRNQIDERTKIMCNWEKVPSHMNSYAIRSQFNWI